MKLGPSPAGPEPSTWIGAALAPAVMGLGSSEAVRERAPARRPSGFVIDGAAAQLAPFVLLAIPYPAARIAQPASRITPFLTCE